MAADDRWARDVPDRFEPVAIPSIVCNAFRRHSRAVACLTESDRLVSAASALAEMGYRAAEIADTPEDERKPLLFLRVEREERHTMQSLEARNQELARFAQEFGLESYDGMEAGPIGS